MSTPRDEQDQPEVNPDDENADLSSDGSGETDLDPDDDREADYDDSEADQEPGPTDSDDLSDAHELREAENRVKAGNTGAESTGPGEPASAVDADPGPAAGSDRDSGH